MKQFEKILVVDDSHLDRFIAEKMMAHLNLPATVITKESAIDALDYLEKMGHTRQLIFVDINMPCMNGFEFLDKLQERQQNNVTVVMLTSAINDVDRNKAEAHPLVHSFLNKPLDFSKLATLQASLA